MRDYSSQKIEIETIKPRTITVNLSNADVKRLAEKSGEGGLTISELLENFIGDLVDGTYSNGSDERMYAEQWYQRCWFAMFSDDTFLKFLLLWGDLDDYIDLMDELESNKKEMAEMTADAEEYSAEERDELQEYINELQKEIDYYWGKFLERKRQKESYVFEKEIENVFDFESIKNEIKEFILEKVGVHTVLNHGINQTDSQSVSVYSGKMSLYVILQVCRL